MFCKSKYNAMCGALQQHGFFLCCFGSMYTRSTCFFGSASQHPKCNAVFHMLDIVFPKFCLSYSICISRYYGFKVNISAFIWYLVPESTAGWHWWKYMQSVSNRHAFANWARMLCDIIHEDGFSQSPNPSTSSGIVSTLNRSMYARSTFFSKCFTAP